MNIFTNKLNLDVLPKEFMKKIFLFTAITIITTLTIISIGLKIYEGKINQSEEYLKEKVSNLANINLSYEKIDAKLNLLDAKINLINVKIDNIEDITINQLKKVEIHFNWHHFFSKKIKIKYLNIENLDATINLNQSTKKYKHFVDNINILDSKVTLVKNNKKLVLNDIQLKMPENHTLVASSKIGSGKISLDANLASLSTFKINAKNVNLKSIQPFLNTSYEIGDSLVNFNATGKLQEGKFSLDDSYILLEKGLIQDIEIDNLIIGAGGELYPNVNLHGMFKINQMPVEKKFHLKAKDTSSLHIEEIELKYVKELSKLFVEKIPSIEIEGKLKDINLSLPSFEKVLADFKFEDIEIHTDEGTFSNIAGNFEYKETGIIQIDSNISMDTKLFPNIKNIHLKSSIELDNESIESKQFQLSNEELNINTEFKITEFISPHLSLKGSLDKIKAKSLKKYWPTSFDEDLLKWLNHAFISGDINKANFQLSGKLNKEILKNKNFLVNIDCSNLELLYAEDWPTIENLNAQIEIKDNIANIKSHNGRISKSNMGLTKVKVDNLFEKEPSNLYLDGLVYSDFNKLKNFIDNTPLQKGNLSRITDLNPKGKLDLNIIFSMRLKKDFNLVLNSSARLKNVELSDKGKLLTIKNLNGYLFFSDEDFYSVDLEGSLFKENTSFSILTVHDTGVKKIYIQANGKTNYNELKNYVPKFVNEKKLLEGNLEYQASLKLPWNKEDSISTINILTDLKQMQVNLPEPLSKKINTPSKVGLELKFYDNKLDVIQLEQSNVFKAKVSVSEKNNQIQIENGHVNFGDYPIADWSSKNKLLIDGQIKTIDFEKWSELLVDNSLKSETRYQVEVLIQKLNLANYLLEDTWISLDNKNTAIRLNGYQLDGTIDKKDGTIFLDFNSLTIPEPKENSKSELSSLKFTEIIDFKCKNFKLYGLQLGNIDLLLHPADKDFVIDYLNIDNPYMNLQSSGFLGRKKTSLKGSAEVKKLEDLLKELSFKKTIKKGNGNLNFDLSWENSLHELSFDDINGDIDFDFEKGNVLGVQPGLGRIVGLLNIDNIKRRLRLDFSDLYEDGLSFDELSSSMSFDKGILSTSDFTINGPTSTIMMEGQANLKNKTVNFNMSVNPKISGTLPIAAAIAAGNPAVGAAIWIFNKALNSEPTTGKQFNYRVTGNWSSPEIKEFSKI